MAILWGILTLLQYNNILMILFQFPWILSDYESDTINLTSCTVYRDLSKPIGAVNPKNEEMLREK